MVDNTELFKQLENSIVGDPMIIFKVFPHHCIITSIDTEWNQDIISKLVTNSTKLGLKFEISRKTGNITVWKA